MSHLKGEVIWILGKKCNNFCSQDIISLSDLLPKSELVKIVNGRMTPEEILIIHQLIRECHQDFRFIKEK